ncbi:MAG: FAD:protein FMN transferase [Aquificae bacterium]|nr:FAD:protein FMN transferase [Aquificota bacterium]
MLRMFKKTNQLKDSVMSTQILIKGKADIEILKTCINIAKDLENKLSAYKEDSFISLINKNAGKKPISCPPEVIEVLKIAVKIAQETEGRFDPTVGALTQKTYGFGTKKEKIPEEKEILEKKRLVNYKEIEIKDNKIFLKKKGMALDLGGIGKGFACEKIIEYLHKKGIPNALVSIGGEICCYGKHWNIGIKHPREDRFIAVITTKEGKTTISTSGDYERFIDSMDYHHILDTKTGKQNNFYSSVTLVSEGFKGARLDAYATAIFNSSTINPFIKKDFDMMYIQKENNNITITEGFLSKVEKLVMF